MNDKVEEGRVIFDKVGVSCSGTAKFLTAMIKLLVEYNVFDDAQKLVSRYDTNPEDQGSYMIGSYIANSNSSNNTEIISKGLELWNNGHKDPVAMRVLIDALRKDGNSKKADEYLEEAEHLWPNEFGALKLNAA